MNQIASGGKKGRRVRDHLSIPVTFGSLTFHSSNDKLVFQLENHHRRRNSSEIISLQSNRCDKGITSESYFLKTTIVEMVVET